MRLVAAGLALSILIACGAPTPAPQTPTPVWATVLREVAIASLRAIVCTTPTPTLTPVGKEPAPTTIDAGAPSP